MDPKHPLLIALGDMSAEDYVLDTLRKTKAAYATLLFFHVSYKLYIFQMI